MTRARFGLDSFVLNAAATRGPRSVIESNARESENRVERPLLCILSGGQTRKIYMSIEILRYDPVLEDAVS